MQSGLYYLARVGTISGFGFAIAKITGSLFKLLTIDSVKTLAAETPMSTSAPVEISARVVSFEIVALARVILKSFIPAFLPGQMTPLVSTTNTLFLLAPAFINNFVQAIPAAPAPLHTILILPISFFEISSAFQSPARQMMAVPC